jgi:hypothetical protein
MVVRTSRRSQWLASHPVSASWNNRIRKTQQFASAGLAPVPSQFERRHIRFDTIPPNATETGLLMTNAIADLLLNPTVTPAELQRILRSGKSSTGKALAAGEIPSFRVGRNRKIPTAWVRAKLGLVEAA